MSAVELLKMLKKNRELEQQKNNMKQESNTEKSVAQQMKEIVDDVKPKLFEKTYKEEILSRIENVAKKGERHKLFDSESIYDWFSFYDRNFLIRDVCYRLMDDGFSVTDNSGIWVRW